MKKHLTLVVITCLLFFVIVDSLTSLTLSAQTANQWTPRSRIPGVHDSADTPYLVADQNRTVHAFHSYPVEEEAKEWAIFYSRWSLAQGWTTPVDILLPFTGPFAFVKGAFLDRVGVMHIIFYCCDDFSPSIYYSHALAESAADARSWSEPELIGPEARQPHTAALAGDDQGNLIVLYSGIREGNGIYTVQSADLGETWSEPVTVFFTYEEQLFPYLLKLIIDQQSHFHALWNINRLDGNGDSLHYARLENVSGTWTEPLALATSGNGENLVTSITSGAIVAHANELTVIYLTWLNQIPERSMRRSLDGGNSWTDPIDPFPPTRGEYGPAVFVKDSNDVLYVIVGDRGRGYTLWYGIWQSNQWLRLEPIVPLTEVQNFGPDHPLEFAPQYPNGVISQGNVLLVAWQTDRGHILNGTWFSSVTLNTPELPIATLPVQPSISLALPIVTPTPLIAQPTVVVSSVLEAHANKSLMISRDTRKDSLVNPAMLLGVSIIPVVLLLSVIIMKLYWLRP